MENQFRSKYKAAVEQKLDRKLQAGDRSLHVSLAAVEKGSGKMTSSVNPS